MEQKPATGQSAGRPPGPSALAESLALRQRWRLKQAAACFEQAVTADPSAAEGWFWLAVTRDNRGQEAEAIPACRQALSLGVSEVNTALRPGPGWLVRCRRPAATLRRWTRWPKRTASAATSQRRSTGRSAAAFSAEHGVHSAEQPGRWAPTAQDMASRKVRVATTPILVSFSARCRPQDQGNDRCCAVGQPAAIRMCGVPAGFSHPSTASSSASGRATQPSVYPSGMSSWRKMPAPLSGGWSILMSMKCW
jgi:hypothetical protein